MTPSATNDDPRWCPFCNPDPQRVFLRLHHVFALWDGFPVTDGHALIVPYRHVPTWFDASHTERAELFSAIDAVCSIIRERGGIDGFNFGVNVGAAAGQTVPHLHQHVIPRRTDDMPDPRGGVRHVIPGKGNYPPRGPSIADTPIEALFHPFIDPPYAGSRLSRQRARPQQLLLVRLPHRSYARAGAQVRE